MDLLDRLLGHDTWTTRQLLLRCGELTDGQLDQPLAMDHGSVRETFRHLIGNMEGWALLIAAKPDPDPDGTMARDLSVNGMLAWLDRASADLNAIARRIVDEDRVNEMWLDQLDDPPMAKSYGGAILHVITHSMHHRAQLLWMMGQLGLTDLPEGDLLGWEQQARLAAAGG